jgi:hypothetical protein
MLVERFGWCAPAERLAWYAVERGSDGVEFLGGVLGEVVPLGEYWLSRQLVSALAPVHRTLW